MSDNDSNQMNEPRPSFLSKKDITVFQSFDEQKNHQLQKMAAQTHEESLAILFEMRKVFLKQYLLSDGTLPPIARIITIKKPFI